MEREHRLADSPRLRTLIEKFRNKAYRNSYVAGHTRRFLASQMRKFRGAVSQSEFGDLIGKRQTVVSRLEDPNYGKWTLQTLFDVAANLNVAVFVRFVDIPTFLKYSENLSEDDLLPQSYDEKRAEAMLQPPSKKIMIKPPSREPVPLFGAGPNDALIEIGHIEAEPLSRSLPVPLVGAGPNDAQIKIGRIDNLQ